MHAFVVSQWNGMDYEDSDKFVVAVFSTLDEAVNFCQNTPAYRDWPENQIIPTKDAYRIQEFDGVNFITEHSKYN